MSEPFLQPAEFQKARLAMRQSGVSQMGADQFLEGRPVSASSDRIRLAQLLVDAVGRAPLTAPGTSPFKPAEFKPAEFRPAEFKRGRR